MLGEALALRRRQHLGRLADRARQAARGIVGQAQLLRAQRLDRRGVDPVLREELDRLAASGVQVLARGQQVLCRLLHDWLELLLLLLGGVDLDVEMLQHPLDSLVELGGIHRSVPAPVAEDLEAGSCCGAAEQRCEGNALESIHDCSWLMTIGAVSAATVSGILPARKVM
jgi:hypothetical protein